MTELTAFMKENLNKGVVNNKDLVTIQKVDMSWFCVFMCAETGIMKSVRIDDMDYTMVKVWVT